MGIFTARFAISGIATPERRIEVEGVVDTGAAYPVIPGDLLRAIGIEPTGKKTFTLADGSRKTMPVGAAWLGYEKGTAPCLVVFGPPTAQPLFGALALESLGLEVDPVNHRLKPATQYLLEAA